MCKNQTRVSIKTAHCKISREQFQFPTWQTCINSHFKRIRKKLCYGSVEIQMPRISLNVRGISNFRKRRAIFTWCRKRKADFMFLQETHSKKDTGAEAVMSHGSSNSCGVAILFRKGVDCVIHTKILDPLGRYIILKAAIKDKLYILINIYENIIVGGDFNCPLNTLLDKKGGIMIPRKSVVASIGCIQSELDLVDIWRLKNPSTKSYTWSQKSPNIFCRLDYWLISNNLHDLVKSVDIIPAIKTDHAAITLDLQNSANEIKGPGELCSSGRR